MMKEIDSDTRYIGGEGVKITADDNLEFLPIEEFARKIIGGATEVKGIDACEAAYRNGYEAGKAELVGKTEQLEEAVGRMAIELAAVKKERDAAVEDLKKNNKCRICKHKKENIQDCQHYSSCGLAYIHFEWRGIDG